MEDLSEEKTKIKIKQENEYFTKKYWNMYYKQLDYKQGIYLVIIFFLIILFIYFVFFRQTSLSSNGNNIPYYMSPNGMLPSVMGQNVMATNAPSVMPFPLNAVTTPAQNNNDVANTLYNFLPNDGKISNADVPNATISNKIDNLLTSVNSKIKELEKKQTLNNYAEPGKFISKGEAECRRCAEEIFGVKFKKGFPKWLLSDKKRQMEIDVYNEKLKIGIEYNGEQHYNPKSSLHKSKKDFEELKKRDILKRQLCDKNGVYLITVPYTVPLEQIKDYILYYLPENHQKRVEAGMSQ